MANLITKRQLKNHLARAIRVDKLIVVVQNEQYPNVAITVDLLTTGIDVPAIAHLVFMRRVRSRILYEQMIGLLPAVAMISAKPCSKFMIRLISMPRYKCHHHETVSKDPEYHAGTIGQRTDDPELLENALNTKGEQPGFLSCR